MQPTVEERSSVHLFIHSVIHFAAVHWLVSQYGKQGNHSAGARTATLLVHVPRSTFARRPGPSSVSRVLGSQPASQLLGSQSGQSTFSIDVARLRTHIASRTKQSPVSNSVRHSLTESCLPFISICQSGQQARQRSSSCSKNPTTASAQAPAQFSLLFIVYCFLCAVLFATLCAA